MQPGTRLGGYEILSALGAGGMGEVYRARDSRLARDVALKILPQAFTRDAERVARFRREAQVLAALNHPNIAAIYGFEESGPSQFLVLELVDGETLDARLRARPGGLPLEEALAIARQIAEALEAAHEKGIVHRDLKPSNIALTAHDQVKVLDFGLAKALETSSSVDSRPDGVTHSPTLTFQGTLAGVILGTAAYMSPEQAKGRAADKRSDVWAFGCVLFEMLTGTRAYQGEDVSDTLATVLKGQPDWNALKPAPPAIRGLVQRCLEKDRRQRISDIAVARYVLSDPHGAAAAPQASSAAMPVTSGWRTSAVVGVLIVTAAIAGAIGWASRRPTATAHPITRFTLPLSPDQPLVPAALGRHALALSRDGSRLAFAANNQLFVRSMDQVEAVAVRGTEDSPFEPFFSPDGQWIAYYSSGHLKKIPIAGGVATTICEAPTPYGASWTGDRILFGGGSSGGIFEVSANGGVPRADIAADAKNTEFLHGPQLLPDGDHVLFTVGSAGSIVDRWAGAYVAVQSLKTGERKVLVRGGTDGQYLPTGHLVYGRDGVVFANAMDVNRLELVGGPTAVVEHVAMSAAGLTGALQFAVSESGSFAYLPAQAGAITTINWRDRKGADTLLTAPAHAYETPRVSPDGSRIVVHATDQDNDIWILDTKNDTLARLTFDKGSDSAPVWTRDGKRIIYNSSRDGVPNLYWKPADGTGQPEPLLAKPPNSNGALVPASTTPDGRGLIYAIGVPADVMYLPLDKEGAERSPRALMAQPQFNERGGDVSPDGKWIAYYSDESGVFQVYVRPFPAVDTGRWQVSADGGGLATWSHDGRELFYVDTRAHLVSVPIQPGPSFAFGKPSTLFDLSDAMAVLRNYDVAPDGSRAVIIKQSRARTTPQFIVVENWFEELKQRVPVSKK